MPQDQNQTTNQTNSTLDKIKEVLDQLYGDVSYGTITGLEPSDPWNYTVFGRSNANGNANLTSFTHFYTVAVVRENYVPESEFYAVLDAMRTIPGMRWVGEAQFDYLTKPGTDLVVELMALRFEKSEKRP